jgi:SAM-dependent methyltransferase
MPVKLDKSMEMVFGGDALSRPNAEDDALFYAQERMVSHLDARALLTVETLIRTLIVEDQPEILDLMAGWDSHLAPQIAAERVVGLSISPRELKRNERLTERVLHDLNRKPALPFDEASFDIVLNTISVAYLTQPFEVFAEVARVLRPGGLHLVVFSNRFFSEKAVRVWQRANDNERLMIVEDYFKACGQFDAPQTFLSAGLPLPEQDRHAGAVSFSDPILAVYAERRGGDPAQASRPVPSIVLGQGPAEAELEQRKARVSQTLRCPYCETPMQRWDLPDTPFCWDDTEYVYVCFNDECSYFLEGFETMMAQGNPGFSYRLIFNPQRNSFHPATVPNPATVRQSTLSPRG